MGRPGYSRRHYERVSPRPDKPGQAAERMRNRSICERALREREARFPTLTAENAQAAIDWQEARILELRATLKES